MIKLTSTSTIKDIEEHWYSITSQPIDTYYPQYVLFLKYKIYELIDIINKSIRDNRVYPLISENKQIYIYKDEMYYDDLYYEFEYTSLEKEESFETRFNDLRKNTKEKFTSNKTIKLICLSSLYRYKINKLSISDFLINEYIYIYYNIDNLLLKGE